MAVQLKDSLYVSSDCKNLLFIETTGGYNATTNPTGWGTPNSSNIGATVCTLTITDPGGTSYVIDLLATGDFPTTFDTEIYTISKVTLGIATNDKITDGIWTYVYNVTDIDANPYSTKQMLLVTCAAKCCVQKMLAKVDITDCCNSKLDEVVKAQTYLYAATQAALCAKPNQAQALLDQVNYLCSKNGCNC